VPTLELISKILSYGEHMVVKEPKWLADEVKNEFAKALKKYKS
jgi:predicted DNA-binding transcriptional regulator YafY